jgi:hypothetical protein
VTNVLGLCFLHTRPRFVRQAFFGLLNATLTCYLSLHSPRPKGDADGLAGAAAPCKNFDSFAFQKTGL